MKKDFFIFCGVVIALACALWWAGRLIGEEAGWIDRKPSPSPVFSGTPNTTGQRPVPPVDCSVQVMEMFKQGAFIGFMIERVHPNKIKDPALLYAVAVQIQNENWMTNSPPVFTEMVRQRIDSLK